MMATYGIQTQTPHEVCLHRYLYEDRILIICALVEFPLGGAGANLVIDAANQILSAARC